MKRKKEINRGITLVALVVTIVVLLILAGITITYVFGDNGIIKLAQEAKNRTEEGMQKEQDELGNLANMLKNESGGGSGDGNEDIVKPPEPPKEEIEETTAFSRANGVIDIVWLNMDNTVRTEIQGPISPKDYLGGLTAIKYDGTNWVEADTTNTENSWYNYIAQTGNTDGKTSNWANAVANFKGTDAEKAYFVWIPRYAYKITYFDTETNANAYRADRNSKTGIIGYSNINGLVDVSTETEKLVTGSEPSNVTGTVKTSGYVEYIPHPAFEFGGTKAGIWVGKFESSGSASKVTIIPNTTSLINVTVGQIFTACQGVKSTYSLAENVDSHMMKNTEWGAVAYLAESKYGRNGTEITINSSSYYTGGGTGDSYKTTNAMQSTIGNIYGIYDMNGGTYEYVAGVLESKLSNSSYYNFTTTDSKYYNSYLNYSDSKKIKGDAVFETSTSGSGSNSWYSDYSYFVNSSNPVFMRGR